MKQAIIITGNVASGKSTVAHKLIGLLPDYQYVCLDDSRMQLYLRDATKSLDDIHNEAVRDVIEKISILSKIIFESCGTSQFYGIIENILQSRQMPMHYFHLTAPVEECIKRKTVRQMHKKQIPPPYSKLSINGFIHRNQRIYEQTDKYGYDSTTYSADEIAESIHKIILKLHGG